MTDRAAFTVDGKPVPNGRVCPNIASFCAYMGATVAERRGGKASDYLRECHDFMTEVTRQNLSVSDPLPAAFSWTVADARDCATEMMEYDQ